MSTWKSTDLGVQLTEALAGYWHERVREELVWKSCGTVAAEDPAAVEECSELGTRVPAPSGEDRGRVVELLGPSRVGVTPSEELQLHPEQSTGAFAAHHPEAKYFDV